ncbi:M48 family metallopeptidase [Methylacidiphilum caldifontis]|uniref:CAAX protease n=1 Tax=Methylacidiphilum caldifontis TaxID=2795386 RepID=A0A4Y8PIC3_9BACT|nr:M48 family metallopeptidase [Methylacidiphilum caldifontis]TFE72072.1 CAAX protease [Methylacidiphilum caldifontis]
MLTTQQGIGKLVILLASVELLWDYWLSSRQLKFLFKKNLPSLSSSSDHPSFAASSSPYLYSRQKIKLGQLRSFFSYLLFLFWIPFGGLKSFEDFWKLFPFPPIWSSCFLLISILWIEDILRVLFSAWRTFGIESRFGFNRTTPILFLFDQLGHWILSLCLLLPLFLSFLWLKENFSLWWFYCWGIWILALFLVEWILPVWIIPLFYRLKPFEDKELKSKIENIFQKNGFPIQQIYVMEGSSRSLHSNAFLTGFGRHRRIILYDTLTTQLKKEELIAVLLHELAHFRLGHLWKSRLVTLLGGLALFFFLGIFDSHKNWISAFDLDPNWPASTFALAIILLPIFFYPLEPLKNWMLRKAEKESDAFAALKWDAKPLIEALKKIVSTNYLTYDSDPLYTLFYESHPSVFERIRWIEQISIHHNGPPAISSQH